MYCRVASVSCCVVTAVVSMSSQFWAECLNGLALEGSSRPEGGGGGGSYCTVLLQC